MTDLYIEKVATVRYRYADCGSAFRHCPEGVDRGGQPRRMRGRAALAWALGLSPRSASHLPAAFAVSISRAPQTGCARGHVTATGADETAVCAKGEKGGAGAATRAC